jgi:hypothetical protein
MPESPTECSRTQDLPALLLDRLEPAAADDLTRHAEECPLCRAELRGLRRVLDRIETEPDREPDRDLWPDIHARIAAVPVARRSSPALPLLAAVAGVVLLLVAGTLFIPSREQIPGPGPRPLRKAGEIRTVYTRESEVLGRALDWLSRSQEARGSWNPRRWGGEKGFSVGLTGLALTAYFGAEENPFEGPHADNVVRGLGYLRSRLGPDGRFGTPGPLLVYNQALAVSAMLEASRFSPSPLSREEVNLALTSLSGLQRSGGGFGWDRTTSRPTSAASVWALQALLLGTQSGFRESGTRVRTALDWLESLVDGQGRVGYRRAGDFPYGHDAMTAAGGLHFLPRPADDRSAQERNRRVLREVRRSAAALGEDPDYCLWYFVTYALWASGNREAEDSARAIQQRLVARQVRTGPNAGSWDPTDRWSVSGGRVYATAMAALVLETHLRSPRLLSSLRGAH